MNGKYFTPSFREPDRIVLIISEENKEVMNIVASENNKSHLQ